TQRRKLSVGIVQKPEAISFHHKETVAPVVVVIQHADRPMASRGLRPEHGGSCVKKANGNPAPLRLFQSEGDSGLRVLTTFESRRVTQATRTFGLDFLVLRQRLCRLVGLAHALKKPAELI